MNKLRGFACVPGARQTLTHNQRDSLALPRQRRLAQKRQRRGDIQPASRLALVDRDMQPVHAQGGVAALAIDFVRQPLQVCQGR